MQMTSQAFRRARSGQPHTSTDAVVATLEPATAAAYRGETQERFSFGMLGIDLNSAEWEKKVMTSWPKKCTFVVREILQTERSYIASLKEIILGYIMPLHGYLLSQGEGPNFIHKVFGNIVKLGQLHEQLLDDMYAACGDPHGFAGVFLQTDFCQYKEYCTNYTDANLFLLRSMEENEKLKLFITQCQNDLDHLLPLHSQLIKPVQRILKYKLMLHEMLKYIDEGDIVHPDMKAAHEKMMTVAEEINTSFDKAKNDKVATPSVIARKRSKEIKSLQRSRSNVHPPTLPEKPIKPKVSELQRSMEFEDSLTLLSANRQLGHSHSSVSSSWRSRPQLAHLIGLFEAPNSAESVSRALSPSPTAKASSPMPKAVPHASLDQSSTQQWDSSPPPQSVATANTTPTVSPPERRESASTLPEKRKTPLTLRKSAPVVQRSKVEAEGEKGDRNSLRDTARNLLENSIDTRVKVKAQDNEIRRACSEELLSEALDVPLTIPSRSYSPPIPLVTGGRTKRPRPPPKQALLPNKPLLGHTAHGKLKRQGKIVPPLHAAAPTNKSKVDNNSQEKFVINMIDGGPVVSLPPVLLSPPPSSSPPTSPDATFYPSMLKPSKNSTKMQSSVLAQQEHMIERMIKGGRASSRHKQTKQLNLHLVEAGGSSAKTTVVEGKKVPLLPPAVTKSSSLKQKSWISKQSSSTENVPSLTSP